MFPAPRRGYGRSRSLHPRFGASWWIAISASSLDALETTIAGATDTKGTAHALLGLTGWPAALANMSAVAVVLWMFWALQTSWIDQVKADRELWHAEFERLHQDSQKQWQAIDRLTRAIEGAP